MAAGLDETVAFYFAPGSLDVALIAYSNQADLQVISASRVESAASMEGALARAIDAAMRRCGDAASH